MLRIFSAALLGFCLTVPALGGFSTSGGGPTNGSFDLTGSGTVAGTPGTPSITSGDCGATTNGVITSGNNQAGLVTIGAAGTTTCTIHWSTTLAKAPNACVVFPASSGAAATGTTVAYVSSITTALFVITGSALASTAYYWFCM